MKQRSFWLLFLASVFGLLFIKLYLHNRSINLSYNKQKLENKRIALRKEQNALRMQLLALKDHGLAEARAGKELGMVQLKTTQIKALETKGHHDS